jgi:hypothetical protein
VQRLKVHRKIALTLVLVYLFLSGFMIASMGGHAMYHGQTSHHAAQHASFICAWMCSAASFVDSKDPTLSQTDDPPFEQLAVFTQSFYSHSSIFSFHIRPPPFSPSL